MRLSTRAGRRAPPGRMHAAGFTVPELVIASSIAVVLLMATYSIVGEVRRAREQLRLSREDAAAARAVADELATALQSAAVVGALPGIEQPQEKDAATHTLICTVAEEAGRGWERRRYQWWGDGDRAGQMALQRLALAGDLVLTPGGREAPEPDRLWESVPAQTIARNVRAVNLGFRPVGEAWSGKWVGGEGPLLVSVEVLVGAQAARATRALWPTQPLLEGGD